MRRAQRANYRELAERTDAGEDPVERVDPGPTLRHKVETKKRAARPKRADTGPA